MSQSFTPPEHVASQPAWDMAEQVGDVQLGADATAGEQRGQQPSRRGMLRLVSTATAAVLLLPWRLVHAKKVGLQLSQVAPLAKLGGSTLLTIKGQELLLIRDTERTVKALDPMCTHKKCKVFYRPKDNDIGCKCHKSKFTLEGIPVSGPAPKPLGRFPAKIKGEKIIIDLG